MLPMMTSSSPGTTSNDMFFNVEVCVVEVQEATISLIHTPQSLDFATRVDL